ncbi:MAG TPA: pre-mRNA processing ribonucleoprotein, partial [Thermoplasmata archaeon]|nr:pre-mRNA processing ribonucleoprotein [Thermoplasmata archaeon]
WVDPAESGFDPAWHRILILEAAEELLQKSWDPSVLVEQAVRAIEELTSTENLLSERLEEWEARRAPPSTDPGPESLVEPEVEAAREQLEALRLQVSATRGALEGAVERAMPHRAPNMVRLLGPLLAARLISLAGGLQRLARLPASTVQVLGAERAFFEHLRGRAPPPRHGLLFLHPSIQGASRSRRGPLARALAGKVSIAARLDAAGSAVRPELLEGFEARVREIESRPPRRKSRAQRAAT